MSRENVVSTGLPLAGAVSIRSRLDEPGELGGPAQVRQAAVVSIRSRLDEPGEPVATNSYAQGLIEVSIRSRLDEPGEQPNAPCAVLPR